MTYQITLSDHDLGQLLDGLEVRAKAWRDTEEYLRLGKGPSIDFQPEDCFDAGEAEKIAAHYESIISMILRQRADQDLARKNKA